MSLRFRGSVSVFFSALLILWSVTLFGLPTVTVVMSGLDNPRGLAFGPEGGLYVAEAGRGGGGPGRVIRVSPGGTRTVVIDGLDRPTSVLVGDGALYISNHGISVGIGEVLRIVP